MCSRSSSLTEPPKDSANRSGPPHPATPHPRERPCAHHTHHGRDRHRGAGRGDAGALIDGQIVAAVLAPGPGFSGPMSRLLTRGLSQPSADHLRPHGDSSFPLEEPSTQSLSATSV
jgi:hypothetical protein